MPKSDAIHGPRRDLIDDVVVFQRAVALTNLEAAWSKVLSNGGAAGGDGVTLARFLVDHPTRLARLREALLAGTYQPHPLRHVDIPKRSGGTRPLAIPTAPSNCTSIPSAFGFG
jgi:CRISP-associated protein Cas1